VLLAARDEAAVIAPWMAVVVVVRELVVTAVRAEMERAGRDFSAGPAGKLKMVLQCATVALVLGARAWPDLALADVGLRTLAAWTAWAAVAATAWSGLEYVVAAVPVIVRGAGEPPRPGA
jgi:phosphatidylglycerophosphate synthase